MFACMCFQFLQNFMLSLEKKCKCELLHTYICERLVNKCWRPSVFVADLHTPYWKHWINQESAQVLEFNVCLWLTRLSSSSISVTRLPRLLSASCSSLSGALCGESMCCQRQEDEIWLSWTYDWQVESCHHGNQYDIGVTSMRFPAYRLKINITELWIISWIIPEEP